MRGRLLWPFSFSALGVPVVGRGRSPLSAGPLALHQGQSRRAITPLRGAPEAGSRDSAESLWLARLSRSVFRASEASEADSSTPANGCEYRSAAFLFPPFPARGAPIHLRPVERDVSWAKARSLRRDVLDPIVRTPIQLTGDARDRVPTGGRAPSIATRRSRVPG